MSLTLTQKFNLANDPNFINEVKMQSISTAVYLSTSSGDNIVKEYCHQILNDPENSTRASQLAHGIAAIIDVPDPASVADSIIKLNLESIMPAYAYSCFNKLQGTL